MCCRAGVSLSDATLQSVSWKPGDDGSEMRLIYVNNFAPADYSSTTRNV